MVKLRVCFEKSSPLIQSHLLRCVSCFECPELVIRV